MGTGLGILAKLAIRMEGASVSGGGLTDSDYPTTPTLANAEEVVLGGSDLVPFTSESLAAERNFDYDETLIGKAATINADVVGIMPAGGFEIPAMYDGIDAILAAALGFELPTATDSPVYTSGTALTGAGGMSNNQFIATAGVFAAGDVGKFIRVTNSTGEGQVRRITVYTNTTTVEVTPIWTTNPVGMTAEMALEFTHTFECSNQLKDQLFTAVYAAYPDGGIGVSATDQIIRRLTVGIEKNQTKPWVYRSCFVNSLSITGAAGGGLSITADLIPFDEDRDSAPNTASTTWDWDNSSPLFEANERVMFSDTNYVQVDSYSAATALTSTDNMCVSGFTLNINNNLKGDDQSACTGNYRVEPARSGMREITGSFTVPRYEADTWIGWRDSETILMGIINIEGSTLTNVERGLHLYLNSFKVESVSVPVGGASVLTQEVGFRCFIPAGQPKDFPTNNLTDPRPEITIQTVNQNPFNLFRDQNREY